MKTNYNNNENKGGTYKIVNTINNKFYIGSTNNFKTRFYDHECDLRKNKHYNPYLQNSFNKYGSNNFVFEVLEVIEDKQKRIDIEQELLDKFWDNKTNCFNIDKRARSAEGNIFSKTPEETRKKKSEGRKGDKCWIFGKTHSEETKKILSESKMGEKNPMFGKPSWLRGKTHSEEAKKKIKDARAKQTFSEETRKKISEATKGENNPRFGKHLSEETKKKISAALKTKYKTNK